MAAPDPDLIDKMHRYFAVECNNRAWELAERESRTADEEHELRSNAHAAGHHWSKVGTPVNDARAKQLLAEVYAQAGDGRQALALAQECHRFFTGKDGTDWDRAFATLELAFAHAVNGDSDEAARLLEKAASQGEHLTEQSEREFFAESHERIAGRIANL